MIEFRHNWLRTFIAARFGRAAHQALIRAWPVDPAPSRQEIWRWMNGQIPSVRIPPARLLPLAGALDMDPFVLFETSADAYATLCAALMRDVASRKSSRLVRDIEWAHDLIVPSANWPPSEITDKYFGKRPWKIEEFRHAASGDQNYFQRLHIRSGLSADHPQVWHFAFKNLSAKRPLWTPYGFVVRDADRVRLYQFRGHTDESVIEPNAESFGVETWYGMGPAEFRVASLHRFTLSVVPKSDRAERCVRFP